MYTKPIKLHMNYTGDLRAKLILGLSGTVTLPGLSAHLIASITLRLLDFFITTMQCVKHLSVIV